MSDAALELDELVDGSWVYVGGCAVSVASVAIACLYAREASNACSESVWGGGIIFGPNESITITFVSRITVIKTHCFLNIFCRHWFCLRDVILYYPMSEMIERLQVNLYISIGLFQSTR